MIGSSLMQKRVVCVARVLKWFGLSRKLLVRQKITICIFEIRALWNELHVAGKTTFKKIDSKDLTDLHQSIFITDPDQKNSSESLKIFCWGHPNSDLLWQLYSRVPFQPCVLA